MAVYSPDIRLCSDDKELLRLLANMILSSVEERTKGNYRSEETVLSDFEAARLLILIEKFVSSKKFIEGSYLIERVLNRESDLYQGDLRDIYLKWKSKFGRSRALATAQWEGFLTRLGVRSDSRPIGWHSAPVKTMTIEHFLKMEEKLAKSAEVHPKVRDLIMQFVSNHSDHIDDVRMGRKNLSPGEISALPRKLLTEVSRSTLSNGFHRPLSTNQIIGVAVIVMDFSTLFTTRDWDVSGFMSTVAGAAPAVALDS